MIELFDLLGLKGLNPPNSELVFQYYIPPVRRQIRYSRNTPLSCTTVCKYCIRGLRAERSKHRGEGEREGGGGEGESSTSTVEI